ncbi:hypothetical protein PYCC9005_002087 [Savitreella phatthalungensis]
MSIHLSASTKLAIAKRTHVAHGFRQDATEQQTRETIARARVILQNHARDRSRWFIVLAAIYTSLNAPLCVQAVWREVAADITASEARLTAGKSMRDAVLKCMPFLGVPRVLGSISALTKEQRLTFSRDAGHADTTAVAKAIDPVWRSLQSSRAQQETSLETMQMHGRDLWNSVYAPDGLASRLLDKLSSWHPDLGNVITTTAYGYNLSATEHVDRINTSAIAVACLRSEEDVPAQLTSHIYGLLKAGATEEHANDIMRVVDLIRTGVL